MDIISVTPDLRIELDTNSWRLISGETTLAAYQTGGINLNSDFSSARRLGRTEILSRDIARVSVGWEPRANNWRLGLMLLLRRTELESGELTWCELASWLPGDPARETARRAGEGLAQLLGCSLQVIDPNEIMAENKEDFTQPSMNTNPVAVRPIPLKPLPIEIGDWSLHASGDGLVLKPTSRWVVNHGLRMIFFLFFSFMFLVLAIGSQTAGLAPVAPEWLPGIALVMSVLLLISGLRTAAQVLIRRHIIVDDKNREVRSQRSMTHVVEWRVPFDQIEYVLTSQEPAHSQGRRNREDPMLIQLEAWLHLYGNQRFYAIGDMGKVSGKSWNWEVVRRHTRSDRRRVLDLAEYDTPLHHAVKQIADRLAVEAYIDIR